MFRGADRPLGAQRLRQNQPAAAGAGGTGTRRRDQVERRSGLVISQVRQNADHLEGSLSDFIRARRLDPTRFHTVLRKLDFPPVPV